MRLKIEHAINNCVLISDSSGQGASHIETILQNVDFLIDGDTREKIFIFSGIDMQETRHDWYEGINIQLKKAGFSYFIGIGSGFITYASIFDIDKYLYSSFEEFLFHFNKKQFTDATIIITGGNKPVLEQIASLLQLNTYQTVFEVGLNAMADNLNSFRSFLKPTTKIMVMVKAFSYGTGTVEVAKFLQKQQADYLGVAIADEGVLLRKEGVSAPIAVMNPEKQSFPKIIDYQLEPCIYTLPLLIEFTRFLAQKGITGFPVHLKLDTGMNRLGFKSPQQLTEAAEMIKKSGNIKVLSVFSHLAGSDDAVFDTFTLEQFEKFTTLSELFISNFSYKIGRHILNSSGIERFPEYQFDMARLGIGLYGVSRTGLNLKSIGTLKTTISQIKAVPGDETVGYSRKGIINGPSNIATIPIGYGDGYSRIFGNRNARVYINGLYAPVIGNVCMDMCMIDITGIDAEVGDEVELFGSHVTIFELAEKAATIPYEILTNIAKRVKRVYILDAG